MGCSGLFWSFGQVSSRKTKGDKRKKQENYTGKIRKQFDKSD